jgi:hypothetical protein
VVRHSTTVRAAAGRNRRGYWLTVRGSGLRRGWVTVTIAARGHRFRYREHVGSSGGFAVTFTYFRPMRLVAVR